MAQLVEDIKALLRSKLSPCRLDVKQGALQGGSEGDKHISIYVVAERFSGVSILQRHKEVFSLIIDLIEGIQALDLITKAPHEET